jgi:hypothetical protein
MIAIVNMSPKGSDPAGTHLYEVRINATPICRFRHSRPEGLATCLDKAAEAVRLHQVKELMELANLVDGKELVGL